MKSFNILKINSILLGILFISIANVNANTVEGFPTLSLEEQQRHTQQRLIEVQEFINDEQALAEIEGKIRQELGQARVQLLNSLKKVYFLTDFKPVWEDKEAQKRFLKDYAVFVASGLSSESSMILEQIITSPEESFKRDILLTDAFLDYFYYNKHLKNKMNSWLYQPKRYRVKALADKELIEVTNKLKNNGISQLITELVPTNNNRYMDIVEAILEGKVADSDIPKLALNAQRLRVIPNFNHGLYVNIPTYQLDYYKNGELALHSVVVVGKKKRPTPVLFSQLSDVVINPPWTIPPTILKEDVIPKYSKNANYGANRGFEVIDYSGKVVSSSSINWSKYKGDGARAFPYLIRQKPGKTAALGRYKFNMPSAQAIFLHDTPNKKVFSRKNRALSSGCIRVQKASQLSSLLLKDEGWTDSKHKSVVNSLKTKYVKVKSSTPVYLYYVTSWIENANLRNVSDIYHLDSGFKKGSVNWNLLKSQL